MKLRWIENKSVKFKMGLSYLAVILFSISILVSVCIYSYSKIKTEVIRSNILLIDNMKYELDRILSIMSAFYFRVLTNQTILSLTDMPADSADYHLTIRKIRETIPSEPSMESALLDYFIYVKNGDTVITRESANRFDEFFVNNIGGDASAAAQWRSAIFGKNASNFTRGTVLNAYNKVEPCAFFIFPFANKTSNSAEMFLIFTIKKNALISIFDNNFNMRDSQFYMTDMNGALVTTSDEDEQSAGFEHVAVDKTEIFYMGQHVMIASPSSDGRYIYTVKFSENEFWGGSYLLRNFMVLCIAIYLLIGAVLIVFMVRTSYNPIKELIDFVGLPKNGKYKDNEFGLLKNELLRISRQQFDDRQSIVHLKRDIGKLKLHQFLEGSARPEKITDVFPNVEESSSFMVVAFQENFPSKEVGIKVSPSPMRNIIANILNDLFKNCMHSFLITETDEWLIYVLQLGKSYESSAFQFSVNYAIQFTEANFGFSFTAFVSAEHDKIEELSKAYDEVICVRDYYNILKMDGIVYYESLQSIPMKGMYFYPSEFEEKLITLLRNGQVKKVQTHMESFFRVNFQGDMVISKDVLRVMIFDLTASLLRATDKSEVITRRIVDKARDIAENSDMDMIMEKMMDLLEMVCNINGDTSEGNLAERVVRMVAEQYQNPDLDNLKIGNTFGISPQYVSMLSRENFGVSMHEYINKKRIEKAMELLLFSDATIEDVMQKSGFSSQRTFYRTFKKFTGMTTNQYRAAYTNEKPKDQIL